MKGEKRKESNNYKEETYLLTVSYQTKYSWTLNNPELFSAGIEGAVNSSTRVFISTKVFSYDENICYIANIF